MRIPNKTSCGNKQNGRGNVARYNTMQNTAQGSIFLELFYSD